MPFGMKPTDSTKLAKFSSIPATDRQTDREREIEVKVKVKVNIFQSSKINALGANKVTRVACKFIVIGPFSVGKI